MFMPEEKDNKKSRKKKLRLAIVAFRGKLTNACGTFEKVTQWHDFIKKNLDPILKTFHNNIPQGPRKKIEEILSRADHTREGLQKSCELLQGEIGKLVKTLTPNWFGNAVNAVFLGAVVAAGAGVYYLSSNAVELTVTNRGCAPLTVAGNMPVSLPGVSLPGKPIPSGSSETFKLPPLSATVDATTRGTITLSTLGSTVTFQLDPGIGVTLNGESLIGKQTTVNLGERPKHEVVVSCR